jgi:DnaJ-class molecular chaperone
MSHYDTLGLHKGATPDEIKKAYRKLASQHHPDKGGDTAKFQEIQTAYDTLSDPDKRQQYDNPRSGFQGFDPHHGGFTWTHHGPDLNINDIFQNFGFDVHGSPFGHRTRGQAPRRNRDIRINIPLTLADTLQAQTKVLNVQTTNGFRENVEVTIPKGVTSETQIKYAGLGDNLFETLQAGDLYVGITIAVPDNYVVRGVDLHTTFTVNCLQVITGTEVEITTLDNRKFLLNIPQGTQPGIRFRIAGQGLYKLNTEQRGDLYAEMLVSIPRNLTDEQITLIKSINN